MLERVLQDLTAIPGVRRVQASRDEGHIRVDVTVDSLEFDACKPIYQYELGLLSLKDYRFKIEVKQ